MPTARAPSSSSSRVVSRLPTTRLSSMSTTALVAAAAVAVGAYALYARRTAVQAEGGEPKPPFASIGLRKLKLARAQMVNHDVKRLRFDLGDPQTKSGLTLTSALLAISFPDGGWIPVLRPYTPVNDLDEKGHIDFLVKHYSNGKQSTHLHSLQAGDSITFLRIPGYSWKANEQAHVALVAGGQGITPCYQLARGILKNGADDTRVTLVWGVNTDDDLVLRGEFALLERQHPGRFRAVYTVAQPKDGSKHAKGFVSRALLEGAGVVPAGDAPVGKVFVCGPPPMEKALVGKTALLAEMGFPAAKVHKF